MARWIVATCVVGLFSSFAFAYGTGEYKLEAALHEDVLKSAKTELWARVFWPEGTGPWPVLVFLHGNHGTCGNGNPRRDFDCSYTETGTCPSGYVVTPNHEGYNFVAQDLVQKGFFVVSINANRGITCGWGRDADWGLNIARGRLVLKHLEMWSQIQAGMQETPPGLTVAKNFFTSKLDLTQVGLMGHSRGGEGVRAALNLFREEFSPWSEKIPGLKIRAIFEIGAVDGQAGRELNAESVAWNQLLPMCDGDVSDLQGRMPFERMLRTNQEENPKPKSLLMVWGANHNFFNTEWKNSDASTHDCRAHAPIFDPAKTESSAQQEILTQFMSDFFSQYVPRFTASVNNWLDLLNPLKALPSDLLSLTRLQRDYVPTVNTLGSLPLFQPGTAADSQVQVAHIEKHWVSARTPKTLGVLWKPTKEKPEVLIPLNAATGSLLMSSTTTLDIRLQVVNPVAQGFSVQASVVDESGKESPAISSLNSIELVGPGNASAVPLQVWRIPLAQLTGVDRFHLRMLKLHLPADRDGNIAIGDVRLSEGLNLDALVAQQFPNDALVSDAQRVVVPEELQVLRVQKTQAHPQLNDQNGYEILLTSKNPFPVLNSLPALHLGTTRIARSRLSADLKSLRFAVAEDEWRTLPKKVIPELKMGPSHTWIGKEMNLRNLIR